MHPFSDATVAVVGLGATGSRMAERLAEKGVTLRGIDRDVLEPGNLETSPLYTGDQVEAGLPKAVAAAEHLAIDGRVADLHGGNVDPLLDGVDLVLDGSDTVATRRILNAWAVKHGVPWVHAAALDDRGTVLPIRPGETACYACIFDHVDGSLLDTCTTAGLDPAIADTVAEQAVKIGERILAGATPAGLTRIHAEEERTVAVTRRADCPVCVERDLGVLDREGPRTSRVCGDGTYHINPTVETRVEPVEMAGKMGEEEKVSVNTHLLRIDGGWGRMTVFRDGRAIVEADSAEEARRRYARIVGV